MGKKTDEIYKVVKKLLEELINQMENNNKIINNKNNIKRNKLFDMLIKRNKFCVDQYDEIGHRLNYRCINNKKKKRREIE